MSRVMLVSNFLSDWGSRTVCEELASRLSSSGIKVLTTSNRRARIPRLFDMLHSVWRFRKDYDVAHVAVYSGSAFLWAEATCRLLRAIGKPYALTLHGGNLPGFAASNPTRVKHLLQSAAAVMAPSRYLQKTMELYRSDIHLVGNALEIANYSFRLRKTVEPTLVWLRSFHEIYNPMLAPRILHAISKERDDAQLWMIGPDKKDGSLEKTKMVAKDLGVQDRIQYVGSVPKSSVPEWLNRGDIFLNTTSADNTPVSVIEAMACGLCVVTTNVGGIPYLLNHERDAMLVPENDSVAMATAVQRVLRDETFAADLSSNARRKAEEYSWNVVLPRWKNIVMNLQGCAKN